MSKSMFAIVAVLGLMSLGGCAQYYQVTDPSSGRVYYTTHLDRKAGGAFAFKDERSQAQVTLQNSEVLPISEEAYRAGRVSPVEKTTTNTTHTSTTYTTTPAPAR